MRRQQWHGWAKIKDSNLTGRSWCWRRLGGSWHILGLIFLARHILHYWSFQPSVLLVSFNAFVLAPDVEHVCVGQWQLHTVNQHLPFGLGSWALAYYLAHFSWAASDTCRAWFVHGQTHVLLDVAIKIRFAFNFCGISHRLMIEGGIGRI